MSGLQTFLAGLEWSKVNSYDIRHSKVRSSQSVCIKGGGDCSIRVWSSRTLVYIIALSDKQHGSHSSWNRGNSRDGFNCYKYQSTCTFTGYESLCSKGIPQQCPDLKGERYVTLKASCTYRWYCMRKGSHVWSRSSSLRVDWTSNPWVLGRWLVDFLQYSKGSRNIQIKLTNNW